MISVIIPTRDRPDHLKLALKSLCSQTLSTEHFEVLVVDGSSDTATKEIVKQVKPVLENVRYLRVTEPGLHSGRHRGLQEAVGGILVFADDDIKAVPTWLAAIEENFHDPAVAMVGGNNYPDFIQDPPRWLSILWHRNIQGGNALWVLSILSLPGGKREIDPLYVWGCNFAIRKEILLEAGGFHPDGFPPELMRFRGDGETYVTRYIASRGFRCIFDSNASVHHTVTAERMTISYFRKRAFYQGISDSYTSLRAAQFEKARKPGPVRWIFRQGYRFYSSVKKTFEGNPEVREVEREMAAGYAEGYAYHQRVFQDDMEVRNWVLKENYL